MKKITSFFNRPEMDNITNTKSNDKEETVLTQTFEKNELERITTSSSSVGIIKPFHPHDGYQFKKTVGKQKPSCQSPWFKKYTWLL